MLNKSALVYKHINTRYWYTYHLYTDYHTPNDYNFHSSYPYILVCMDLEGNMVVQVVSEIVVVVSVTSGIRNVVVDASSDGTSVGKFDGATVDDMDDGRL